jgi:hypothetical protein
MPKKPFSLRSVQCTHIKYAKKMKKIDREVIPDPEKIRYFCESACERKVFHFHLKTLYIFYFFLLTNLNNPNYRD